jgi:hypothetical protein
LFLQRTNVSTPQILFRRRLAEHLSNLMKKESPMTRPEEMQQMRDFIKSCTPNGMVAIAKHVIEKGETSLTEPEFTELWIAEAGSPAAFAKEFAGPPNEKHRAYAIVRDANQVKTYLKVNMMSVEPVSTEVGNTSVSDDSFKAADQLKALVEEQRRRAPTLSTSALYDAVYADPANRTITARAHPRRSSTSGSELQR